MRLLAWYARNGRDLPWRHTIDPYAILVSEVMLQQTRVARVAPKYTAFMAAYPTLEALAGADLAAVLAAWSGLGYNNRAERLLRCARAVVARNGARDPTARAAGGRSRATGAATARLPTTLQALQALPGVGPYTARAILIFSCNVDLAAVDANVRRVLTHELDLAHDLPPARLQQIADAALPRGRSRDWHNALMDYGALVLTGRATGIAPRTRQTRFAGSRRWFRAAALRLLLAHGPRRFDSLAEELALEPPELLSVLQSLARDGLIALDDETARVP